MVFNERDGFAEADGRCSSYDSCGAASDNDQIVSFDITGHRCREMQRGSGGCSVWARGNAGA
jgi:hypothetical protein